MVVTVDGELIDTAAGANPVDLLEQTQARLGAQGRVLRAVAVDGVSIEGDWRQALDGDPAPTVQALDLTSSSLEELVRDALADAQGLCAELAGAFRHIALELQRGEDRAAFQAYSEAIDTFASFCTVAQALMQQGLLPAVWVNHLVTELSAHMDQAMAAWDRGDYVLMADLLLHELLPLLEQASNTLTEQIEEVEEEA